MSDQAFSPLIEGPNPLYTLGQVLWDDKGKAWQYIKASTNISATHTAGYQIDFQASAVNHTLLNTTFNGGNAVLGVAAVAISSGNYGWVQVYGLCRLTVGTVAAASYSYTSATDGILDDSSSGQSRTRRVVFMEGGSGTIDAYLFFPGGDRTV